MSEPTFPHPPRYRHLLRLTVLAIGVGVALVLVRWGWGIYAHRALEAEVERVRGRGEPIRPEDFDPVVEVKDSRNAGKLLGKAGAAVTYTAEQRTWENNFTSRLPLSAYDMKVLGAIKGANGPVLKLARQARSLPEVDWGVRLRGMTPNMVFNAAGGYMTDRHLANLLGYMALYEHSTGNDAEAVELLRDTLRLADAVEVKSSGMISHLVAIGIAAMACDRTQHVAQHLRVTGESREQVRALIGELLDETSMRAGLRRSIQGERMFMGGGIPMLAGQMAPPATVWALRPMFELDARRTIVLYDRILAAAEAADQPTAAAMLPDEDRFRPDFPRLHGFVSLLSSLYYPSMSRFTVTHFRGLGERRFAAVSLAIRLYREDHGGLYPGSLEELVPTYLPGVPADPFVSGGRSIRYRPDADPPELYSVGENGTDDGASTRPANPNMTPPVERWRALDNVLPLVEPPNPEPTTEPTTQELEDAQSY